MLIPPQGGLRVSERYIDPEALMQIRSLELRAKVVVEGFLSGLHRSPYHGFSVEFSEYREYVPGDDLRFLDWKVFARSDHYFVKRFEDETNLRCHLLVDCSRSMNFGTRWTKADYARTLAATLGHFLTLQRDAVGLALFDDVLEEFIPPRYRPGHFHRLLLTLERAADGTGTDLSRPLEQVAERIHRRGLLVLVSDLLAPLDLLERRLADFRARGNEVALFQILDPAEVDLGFDTPALFHDVETGQQLYVDPDAARDEYQRRLREHQAEIQRISDSLGVACTLLTTSTPLEVALGDFLRSRARTTRVARRR